MAVPSTAMLPKGRPVCKYEGKYAFNRRRMQYDIGDKPLDPPEKEPKKTLDPEEHKKLSGDMRELYDRLLPSEESEKRRHEFVQKIEQILYKEWPGYEFKVHVFGSSGNMLCTSDSDGLQFRPL
jgi:DNA polymerase sigma